MSSGYDMKALEQLESRLRTLMPDIPKIAGNEIINFSLDNFRRQGFLGSTFQRWPARKTTAWGKRRNDNSRAILVKTGRLKRATRIIQADWNQVKAINDTPYARTHNEGLQLGIIQKVRSYNRIGKKKTTVVREHSRKINQKTPKRTFLADSPYLRNSIRRAIAAHISKQLR